MFRKLVEKWKRYQWKRRGCPEIHYTGFHCGCCGRWTIEDFSMPDYKSDGEWQDTIGLCRKCVGPKNYVSRQELLHRD